MPAQTQETTESSIVLNLKPVADTLGYQILSIEIPSVVELANLTSLSLPSGMDFKKGVVITGRGPIWLYATLTHLCHSFVWVATYDPRIGAIVVQSHSKEVSVGDVIPDPDSPLDDELILQ
jgi:CRISPR-associated protein Csx3